MDGCWVYLWFTVWLLVNRKRRFFFFFSTAAWGIKDEWCFWRLIWFRFYFSGFMFLFTLKIVPDLNSCHFLFLFYFYFFKIDWSHADVAFYNVNKKIFYYYFSCHISFKYANNAHCLSCRCFSVNELTVGTRLTAS